MKLWVLIDNNTIIDKYFLGEPALSFYIEDEEQKILFDTGYSDVFIKNAKKMGIDLSKVNKLVISHGHNDHTGGLKILAEKYNSSDIKLITHPDCFEEKYDDDEYIGSPLDLEKLKERYDVILTRNPIAISSNITYLGEIPTYFDFEERKGVGIKECRDGETVDYVMDDSAIVYKGTNGLFIITGCSHSGICNIIEYAKKVCGCDKVYGVIGGFHLFENDIRLKKTIEYMSTNNIKNIYPCHCVSLQAKIEMGKTLCINEIGVGVEIEIL